MNIWILNHYACSPDLPGGTRHYELARELVSRGNSVTLFASSFHYTLLRHTHVVPGKKTNVELINGVRFVWLRTFPYSRNNWRRVVNMVSYMVRVRQLGRSARTLPLEEGSPDVVIGSSVHLLAVLSAWSVARYYKCHFVMEVRDLWPQTLVDMGVLRPLSPVTCVLRLVERFLYRRAERIITVLPLAAAYIARSGIDKNKIVWIPNGVRLKNATHTSASPTRAERGFRVLYLGAHGRANALEVVLNAADLLQRKGLTHVRYVLVGDGPEKPKLQRLAKDKGLMNVDFLPAIPKIEVPSILAEADALVFNLEKVDVFRYGISSNKLFDYMGAGKPILFCVDAANNPVAEAKGGVTVPSGIPAALAEATLALSSTSTAELDAMGRRNAAYVAEHHNLSRLGETLHRCLKEVVEH